MGAVVENRLLQAALLRAATAAGGPGRPVSDPAVHNPSCAAPCCAALLPTRPCSRLLLVDLQC